MSGPRGPAATPPPRGGGQTTRSASASPSGGNRRDATASDSANPSSGAPAVRVAAGASPVCGAAAGPSPSPAAAVSPPPSGAAAAGPGRDAPHDHTGDPWALYEPGVPIGTGFNCEVFHCRHRATGIPVAIKVIDIRTATEQALTNIRREIAILLHVRSPNVVALFDYFYNPRSIYLVLEFIGGGELYDVLASESRLSEPVARHYFRQLLQAIAKLHEHGICHRDIKPENIFLDASRTTIKLGDFGFSKLQPPDDFLTTPCGTPPYIAPEILLGDYDLRCDLWSAGVCLFVMLDGKLPFFHPNINILFDLIKTATYTFGDQWRNISPQARNLIERLLVLDPSRRLSASDALCHPWFQGPSATLGHGTH